MLTYSRLGVAVLCLLAASACRHRAGRLTDGDRTAIRGGVAKLDQAMLARDWPGAALIYTEDAILMPPHLPAVRGRDAIQKLFSGFPPVSAFHQDVAEIEGHGALAYARATYEATMRLPGTKAPLKDRGKVLAIWRKQPDGSWLVTQAIWNSDLAEPGLRPGS